MTSITTPFRVRPAGRTAHVAGFWIIALAFLTEMAFCAVPTPLYAIYQHRDGFPTIVVTVIFAAYALGVMLSLYLAGHLSDGLGRRWIVVGSLMINVLAAILFLVWNDVAGLIVARFISGLGIGILTATATAYLAELGAIANQVAGRAAIVATFANLGGIALGPLAGGLIATWSTTPLSTPFVVFAIVLTAEAILAAFVPETVDRPEQRPAYRPQRIAVPASQRGAFWAAAAAAFGAFAVFGTFMGLSSTFLGGLLGQHSPLLAGVAPFLLFMAAATAQVFTARLGIRPQLQLAIALGVIGLISVGASALLASLALFLIGGGLTGAGVGILFRGAVVNATAAAEPGRRGETLAALFLIAYAGMTLPPLLTASALTVWPVVAVLVGLAAVSAMIIIGSGSRMLRHHRSASSVQATAPR